MVLAAPQREVFYGFCGLALIIAAWEWTGLAGFKNQISKIVFCLVIGGILLSGYLITPSAGSSVSSSWTSQSLYLVLVLWPLFFVLVIAYPGLSSLWNNIAIKVLLGIAVFIQAWASVILVRQQDFYLYLIVYPIALVALSDIGAYFAGKRFGRIKLAPRVSPGKSWEGVIGGMLAAVIFSLVAYLFLRNSAFAGISIQIALTMAVVVSLVSVVGDLSISMLKRAEGLKDSGQILPGHGGVLDRIDGMIAALPIFVFMMLVLADS